MRKLAWKPLGASLAILLPFLMIANGRSELPAGSWSQINQSITRPAGWQQYVDNSAYSLGEKRALEDAKDPVFEISYGSYPSIDGSTVAVPMAVEFARQHLPLSDTNIEGFVYFSTTHSAYMNLIHKQPNLASQIASENAVMAEAHPVDIIIATEPSDEELLEAEQADVALIKEPVCLDAFVFITHKDNPIDSLTIEQIQKIYSSEITSWAEVGGDDTLIEAYARDKNSGSQTAMENLVMRGTSLNAQGREHTVIGYMGSLVDRVAAYQNNIYSIGYTYKYYIDTLYKNDSIKVIAINGIAPTPENLRSKAYPFTAAYYGVIRADDEGVTGGLFLEWMLSEEGQRCIRQAGYTPVMDLE